MVFGLVHRSGDTGLSRSELTTRTGLNRSTIATLVAELVDLGLVAESGPSSRGGVGRPSPIVTTTDHALGIAVNPEIDVISLAVVGLGGRVLDRVRVPTPGGADPESVVRLTASAIHDLWQPFSAEHRFVGVGVAVPGLVRARDGLVRLAPHLGWTDEPYTRDLADALDRPVMAANDASLGVLAESTFGAGRGIRDLVYLNGGASGIGGGVIAGGVPLAGAGYAGELGHTLVNTAGARCHCGAIGCLETEVSRMPLLELTGLGPDRSDDLGAALAASTALPVRTEIRRQLDHLAVALRNAVNTLNPELIVLGGFLADLYDADEAHLHEVLGAQALGAAYENLHIVPAELGSRILLVGAAELVFGGVIGDPSSIATATRFP